MDRRKALLLLVFVMVVLFGGIIACGGTTRNSADYAACLSTKCKSDCRALGYEYHYVNNYGCTYWSHNSCQCWNEGMDTRIEAWNPRRK